jgi:hypothetical protein
VSKVVRLSPREHPCRRCGSAINVPHETLHDCERALHQEMTGVLKRVRALAARRAELTKERMIALARKHASVRKRRA